MDFIIIASARTGSTMLCNYLNLQKDIKCHYELFINDRIQISTDISEKENIIVSELDKHKTNNDKLVRDIIDNNLIKTRYDDTIELFDTLKKHKNIIHY